MIRSDEVTVSPVHCVFLLITFRDIFETSAAIFHVIMSSSPSSASTPPLSSLRLLVPPLRLLTAAMWQVAHQQCVKHYGMLEDFVSLVTEALPELLTDRQRSLLLLALRAKVTDDDS